MSGEGWPTVREVERLLRKCMTPREEARAVVELYRPHLEQARQHAVKRAEFYERRALLARDAMREIARVSIPELNPDGVDQAAFSMRLVAVAYLEAVGLEVPEQRASVDDGRSCICGRNAQIATANGQMTHPERVARMVPPEYRLVALLHDAVEDGYLDQNFATAQIGHFAMWGIAHLSRGDNETYAKYIDRIATTKGVADTCARTVKVADLLDNLHGRPHPPNPSLRRRYEKALATLTAAMEKRGEPVPSRPGESEA